MPERSSSGKLICTPLADRMAGMEFIETPTFTRLVTQLLTDEEYREGSGHLA